MSPIKPCGLGAPPPPPAINAATPPSLRLLRSDGTRPLSAIRSLQLQPAAASLPKESGEGASDGGPRIRWSRAAAAALAEPERQMLRNLPRKLPDRCKAVLARLFSFSGAGDDDVSLDRLLASWVRAMRPIRADWLAVFKELNNVGSPILPEVMEFALLEDSFEASVRDYTKLIHLYGKSGLPRRAEDAVRRMAERGLASDHVILTVLIDMYGKTGDVARAKNAFEDIRLLGLAVDRRAYGAMVMALVRAGMLDGAESLIREMEEQEIYAGKEVYKALLRAYSLAGDADGAQRVFDAMQFAGIIPDAKHCALLVNSCCAAGETGRALSVVANMMRAGLEPTDKCVSLILGAFEKEGKLSEALAFLAELEESGVMIGRDSSVMLAGWLRQIGVVGEAEQLLSKFYKHENEEAELEA